ncbi:MAG: N-methyl-L-tryptophan oxidase [Thermoanaerobaculia bacterium]|nr:N-methyl-L-tryptophan oxidase [Thermoanaerobaculia bacterium]
MPTYDVIVAGLGAMGSATVAELARRGVRVLGIDAHRPPHDRGSSHGETRVIREAYWEDPLYVPLVRRAYDGWRRLERDSGETLLVGTGALLVGREDGTLIPGTLASARRHDLDWESLSPADVRRRWPQLRPDDGCVGILEKRAGTLFPERCIRAFLDRAATLGAELRLGEPIVAWSARDGSVEVETAAAAYAAGSLVLATGAWTPALAPGLPLEVERQVLHWFRPDDAAAFGPDRLPVFHFEEDDGAAWYGLPDFGTGIKAGIHHRGQRTTAEELAREVTEADRDAIRSRTSARIHGVAADPVRSTVCMYTNTPDHHFLVDRHPEHRDCLVVSPCSGHGFKFAGVIGEMAADLVTGASQQPPEVFRLGDRAAGRRGEPAGAGAEA